MKKILAITFMILITAALGFSPEKGEAATQAIPCIVHPDVLEACDNSGGRFDYKLCECVYDRPGGIPIPQRFASKD